MTPSARISARAGVAYALAAIGVWGFIPLLYEVLRVVRPAEVLAHRVLWSLAIVLVLCAVQDRARMLRLHLADRRALLLLAITAVLIASNWLGFIFAVNREQVLQASLGYFISPLFSVLLGIVLLRERLSWQQSTAVLLAVAGVLNHTLAFGAWPWIALWLASSFALYSYLRKIAHPASLEGLTIELLWLAPFAGVYVVLLGSGSAFGIDQPALSTALMLAGITTALPLVWFTAGARRLRLATIGILQFLSPSIQFVLAVTYFGEPFATADLVTFGCIWAAVVLYMWPRTVALRAA
jgi:chloramphenicol-sensitive protein RarD